MIGNRILGLTDDERRRIDDIVRVVTELDSVPLDAMDALYYAHGYNELRLAVEDLLAIVGGTH